MRDIDINLSKTSAPAPQNDPEVEAHIRRRVSVLNRSVSRFEIPNAPSDIHYEWHPDDPETYARLSEKGFITNDDLAKKSRFTQTDGTGSPRIGDVRLYTIPKKLHEANQRIEAEQSRRNMDPRLQQKQMAEELLSQGVAGLEPVNTQIDKATSISGTLNK
jgi:hypothetical protein